MNKTSKIVLLFVGVITGSSAILLVYTNDYHHATYHSDCPFCRTVAHEEGTILYEDADVAVITKNRPAYLPWCVDCLIIPKKHIRNLKDLDANDSYDQTILSKMGFVAQKLGEKLCGSEGFRCEINNDCGQGVFHLHMHFKSPENWKIDPQLWK